MKNVLLFVAIAFLGGCATQRAFVYTLPDKSEVHTIHTSSATILSPAITSSASYRCSAFELEVGCDKASTNDAFGPSGASQVVPYAAAVVVAKELGDGIGKSGDRNTTNIEQTGASSSEQSQTAEGGDAHSDQTQMQNQTAKGGAGGEGGRSFSQSQSDARAEASGGKGGTGGNASSSPVVQTNVEAHGGKGGSVDQSKRSKTVNKNPVTNNVRQSAKKGNIIFQGRGGNAAIQNGKNKSNQEINR